MLNKFVLNKVNNLADVELIETKDEERKTIKYSLLGKEHVLSWVAMKDQEGIYKVMILHTKNGNNDKRFHMQTLENFKCKKDFKTYYEEGKFFNSLSKSLDKFK